MQCIEHQIRAVQSRAPHLDESFWTVHLKMVSSCNSSKNRKKHYREAHVHHTTSLVQHLSFRLTKSNYGIQTELRLNFYLGRLDQRQKIKKHS